MFPAFQRQLVIPARVFAGCSARALRSSAVVLSGDRRCIIRCPSRAVQ